MFSQAENNNLRREVFSFLLSAVFRNHGKNFFKED